MTSPAHPLAQSTLHFRRETNFTRALHQPTPLSRALIALITSIHFAVLALGALLEGRITSPDGSPTSGIDIALLFGAKINPLILHEGQLWRLISSIFLHGGWIHLIFNTYALVVLCPLLEKLYGSRRFALLFLLSGIAGSLASTFFTPGPSVGASGALFGLLGAMLIFGLRFQHLIPPQLARAFTLRLFPWVVLNIALGFIPGLQLDNAAHIGGLIAGSTLALILSTPLEHNPSRLTQRALHLSFPLVCLLLSYAAVFTVQQIALCSKNTTTYTQCHPPTDTPPSPKPPKPSP